jgi:hypothetical protein
LKGNKDAIELEGKWEDIITEKSRHIQGKKTWKPIYYIKMMTRHTYNT